MLVSTNTISDVTFRGNLETSRYGWLRLTPAYSVSLVSEILQQANLCNENVLDPFCGTGTTALACAEQGIPCDTTDINPFLIWLTEVKSSAYKERDLENFVFYAASLFSCTESDRTNNWVPPIFEIEKWWASDVLDILLRMWDRICLLSNKTSPNVINLLKLAFCRTLIEHANISFGHQSMSFKKRGDDQLSLFSTEDRIRQTWNWTVWGISEAAKSEIKMPPRVLLADARNISRTLPLNYYSLAITSPPYPNRMSYIRELRPYMYWLGYLSTGRQAGELDWEAIGGTWGCATSNVAKWEPVVRKHIPFNDFPTIVTAIEKGSPILSKYVEKYFHDIGVHCEELFNVMKPGGKIFYIVGNSKFYDVLLPVEQIYAAIFRFGGFVDVKIDVLRKRSSKKELYEFIVKARKP